MREGYQVSKNRLYRLYREEGLSLRYRSIRKRRMQTSHPARAKATAANQAWSLDFVADQLAKGERFRALTIVSGCAKLPRRACAMVTARFVCCCKRNRTQTHAGLPH
jgi:hypothetical protein